MQNKPAVFLAGTQCAAGLDEKLNKWYNETHIPLLLKSEHLIGVTRYKLAPVTRGQYPTYLAIYDFKDRKGYEAWMSSREMTAAQEDTKKTWAEGGFEAPWMALYEPLKTWQKTALKSEPVVFVVGTQCHPDDDEKFNKWYNETHIPDLLKSEHLSNVTRYKLSPATEGQYPAYLALYEFKDLQAFKNWWYPSPDVLARREERKRTWAKRDFEVKWINVYEPIKSWHR